MYSFYWPFFFVWKHKLALSLVALRCCWSNTFAKLLWSTWLMWWTSAYCWKFMHPVMNAFFFPAFVQSLQIINKSSPKLLVCSHPNYFSYLSKNWLSSSLFMFHCHVTGTFKWVLYSTANDPETANDPQNGPQMILDRKWSLKSAASDPVKTWGMEWILWDWLQKRTDYKKKPFSLAF